MATTTINDDMVYELKDIDEDIIEHLAQIGNNAPANIADAVGHSRQYTHQRLQLLEAAGHIENLGRGVYTLVEDPRDH